MTKSTYQIYREVANLKRFATAYKHPATQKMIVIRWSLQGYRVIDEMSITEFTNAFVGVGAATNDLETAERYCLSAITRVDPMYNQPEFYVAYCQTATERQDLRLVKRLDYDAAPQITRCTAHMTTYPYYNTTPMAEDLKDGGSQYIVTCRILDRANDCLDEHGSLESLFSLIRAEIEYYREQQEQSNTEEN